MDWDTRSTCLPGSASSACTPLAVSPTCACGCGQASYLPAFLMVFSSCFILSTLIVRLPSARGRHLRGAPLRAVFAVGLHWLPMDAVPLFGSRERTAPAGRPWRLAQPKLFRRERRCSMPSASPPCGRTIPRPCATRHGGAGSLAGDFSRSLTGSARPPRSVRTAGPPSRNTG